MTIGPEPITNIVFRSSRRGTVLSFRPGLSARSGASGCGATHQVSELAEEVAGVVGSGCGFGVVLHGEGLRLGRSKTLDHAVVEVHVGDLGLGDRISLHGVVVV